MPCLVHSVRFCFCFSVTKVRKEIRARRTSQWHTKRPASPQKKAEEKQHEPTGCGRAVSHRSFRSADTLQRHGLLSSSECRVLKLLKQVSRSYVLTDPLTKTTGSQQLVCHLAPTIILLFRAGASPRFLFIFLSFSA